MPPSSKGISTCGKACSASCTLWICSIKKKPSDIPFQKHFPFSEKRRKIRDVFSQNKMKLLSPLTQNDLQGKRVLVRADFNVPLPMEPLRTILVFVQPFLLFNISFNVEEVLCSVVIWEDLMVFRKKIFSCSGCETSFDVVRKDVRFLPNPLGEKGVAPGEVVLLENTRFLRKKKKMFPSFLRF